MVAYSLIGKQKQELKGSSGNVLIKVLCQYPVPVLEQVLELPAYDAVGQPSQ